MSYANNNILPSFNKYSGVVEWKNAIFLWINIGLQNSEFPNNFLYNNTCITWYGGQRMYEGNYYHCTKYCHYCNSIFF